MATMWDTIIGGVFGGVLRFAPEVLKFFDRKGERAHELARLDKELAVDRQRAELNIRALEAQDAAAVNAGELQAMLAAIEAQATPTGIGWVDALSATVRPVLTYYWCVVFYTAGKIAQFVILLGMGVPPVNAVADLWGPSEQAVAASMISYWFADRSLRKGGGIAAPH